MSGVTVSYTRYLRTILMMFCGLVLIHTCGGKEFEKDGSINSTQFVSRTQRQSPPLNNYKQYSTVGNGKTKPCWQYKLKNVKYVITKLINVINRYDEKESEFKILFSGIAGFSKVRKFRDLVPKHRQLKEFNCGKFKYPKTLKKWTFKFLLKFHGDVQSFYKYFELLINHEKSPLFKKKDRSNGKRLIILTQLENDLKMLDTEILEIVAMRIKRLNSPRQGKSLALTYFPPPKSQTDLMVMQWEILQSCKAFLKGWKRKLRKICMCWKKKLN